MAGDHVLTTKTAAVGVMTFNRPQTLNTLDVPMLASLHGAEMPLGAALAYERSNISLLFDSNDAHEGCSAFLDKRKPNFEGR